jgi:large subunit ribosomal protein L21
MEPEIAGIPDIAGVPAPSAPGDAAGDAVVDLTETDAADSTPPMPDDLQQISGVGPALERSLHEEGITSFRQLALLDETDIAELRSRSPRLATRLRRNSWVSQARRLHIDTHGDEP